MVTPHQITRKYIFHWNSPEIFTYSFFVLSSHPSTLFLLFHQKHPSHLTSHKIRMKIKILNPKRTPETSDHPNFSKTGFYFRRIFLGSLNALSLPSGCWFHWNDIQHYESLKIDPIPYTFFIIKSFSGYSMLELNERIWDIEGEKGRKNTIQKSLNDAFLYPDIRNIYIVDIWKKWHSKSIFLTYNRCAGQYISSQIRIPIRD